MSGAIYLHFVWVAGTRMIEQGTDGLSRGDMINGTMAGEMFLSFVPISDSAFDWSPKLKKWILDTLVPIGFCLLDYNNWFEFALEDLSGCYIWCPPPCITDVAVDQACEIKLIHPDSSHIFVVRTIMTNLWRKQLMKLSDISFIIPAGSHTWKESMHKPV